MPAFNLFLASVLLPLVAIVLLTIRARRPFAGWLATFILASGVCGFSVLAAPWGWFGLPVRYAIAVLFAIAVIVSLRRPLADDAKPESPIRMILKVMIGLFFGSVALGVLQAREVPPGAIDLEFPLEQGRFLIHHGGSTAAANMHAAHPTQRYAVDITKLTRFGTRARGLYPAELERYAIFGAVVVSPCDGMVLRAVDGVPDLPPPRRDEKHPAGNHIVLRCGGAEVWLAHLQNGSIIARPGTVVRRRTPLARAGNSGNSPEPHLHLRAERGGRPVPVRMSGRWLVRNDVVSR